MLLADKHTNACIIGLILVIGLLVHPSKSNGQQTGIVRGLSSSVMLPMGQSFVIPFSTTQLNVGGFESGPGTIGGAQEAGLHTIAGSLHVSNGSGSSTFVIGSVQVNGNEVDSFLSTLQPGSNNEVNFSTLANLNPGDDVSVRLQSFVNTVQVHSPYTNASMRYTPAPEPNGDFNSDGIVDAADYVAWRKAPLSFEPGYDTWREQFGQTIGNLASGAGNGSVPEPRSVSLLIFAILASSYRIARQHGVDIKIADRSR